MTLKRSLAPEIFRQRLLIEAYYDCAITRELLSDFLTDLAKHLDLRTYADPVIYSPTSGMGKDENGGFDAFVPLIDSGISAYIWTQAQFASILLYTCKGFDEKCATDYTISALRLVDPVEIKSF